MLKSSFSVNLGHCTRWYKPHCSCILSPWVLYANINESVFEINRIWKCQDEVFHAFTMQNYNADGRSMTTQIANPRANCSLFAKGSIIHREWKGFARGHFHMSYLLTRRTMCSTIKPQWWSYTISSSYTKVAPNRLDSNLYLWILGLYRSIMDVHWLLTITIFTVLWRWAYNFSKKITR